jgi:SEC-C motif
MGGIADALVAYAQPLLDQTDGSPEDLQKALTLTQLCYNLALLPEDSRNEMLNKTRQSLKMDDEEFEAFQRSIIVPMIKRHEDMFPRLHRRFSNDTSQSGPSVRARPRMAASAEKYPGTDRYAPCPCNSGQKYKFCCGMKGRSART